MAARDYQYETSPRKLEPEYEPRRKKKNSKAKAPAKQKIIKPSKDKKQTEKEKAREARKGRFLLTFNCLLILLALFAIIMRNSLISQSFAQIQILKSEIAELEKENDQLEISIQNSLNLSSIEQEAKEKLGMQKLTSKQTVYLNFPKKDYVEPSTEEIVIEECESTCFSDTITNFFKKIF